MIAAIVAACTLFGLLYAVFTQPLYTASVTVRPVVGDQTGLSGRLGSAAALAGISLGSGGSEKEEYLAIIRSRELGERFIERYGLKPYLFPDRWDEQAERWSGEGAGEGENGQASSGGFRSWLSRVLAEISGDEGWRPGRGPEPSMWEAYKEFSKIRQVSENEETGIVTVEFSFRNPALAARWANDYVAMANAEIRQRTIEEASRALDYLNEQVDQTSMAGLRETIFRLIQTQLERITLANARPQYAFNVLDPAVVPEERSHPKRTLIVILSMIVGSMLGVFLALLREGWNSGFTEEVEADATLSGESDELT